MNKIEEQAEILINTTDYDKLLNYLDTVEYKQNLTEEDYLFYKGYCYCKLEKAQSALECFVKVLSINQSLKYKMAIFNLFNDIFFVCDVEYDDVIGFFNELKKIFSPKENDIYIIKIYRYFYYAGYISDKELIETIDIFLDNNRTNSEIYEIKAEIFQYLDENDTAVENLQTAVLLNKNAKKRLLNKIKQLKEQ